MAECARTGFCGTLKTAMIPLRSVMNAIRSAMASRCSDIAALPRFSHSTSDAAASAVRMSVAVGAIPQ